MLAENKETSPKPTAVVSAEAASAKPARVRSSSEPASARRAKKRATRRAAAPRTSATSNLVNLNGEVDADGVPEVSASQALIDLEIRRSMREARRTRDQQLQQQREQLGEDAAAANSMPASSLAADQPDIAEAVMGLPEEAGAAGDGDALVDQAPGGHAPVAHPRQHPGHGDREAVAASNPLNQHLGLMTQQLTAAHRVIGRVSAERDGLRQQVADLQGIPVEDVVIASLAASADPDKDRRTQTSAEPDTAETPSRLAKLNYFGGEDVAQMRRRRQTLVLSVLAVIALGGLVARQIGWNMPDDISKDSLAALPVLGNFMYVFLAGWMLFRVVKVSSKGVRWIFPSEDRRRRRR